MTNPDLATTVAELTCHNTFDPDGSRHVHVDQAPGLIRIADELLEDHDPQLMDVDQDRVTFLFADGPIEYRLEARESWSRSHIARRLTA